MYYSAAVRIMGRAVATLLGILLVAAPDPNGPAFDIADVACRRRLLSGLDCGTRAPTEMTGPLFPGVRSDLADITED